MMLTFLRFLRSNFRKSVTQQKGEKQGHGHFLTDDAKCVHASQVLLAAGDGL